MARNKRNRKQHAGEKDSNAGEKEPNIQADYRGAAISPDARQELAADLVPMAEVWIVVSQASPSGCMPRSQAFVLAAMDVEHATSLQITLTKRGTDATIYCVTCSIHKLLSVAASVLKY